MKHTIELQNDKQLNLLFMALDVLLKLQIGQWNFAFRNVFPYGEGLEIFKKEYRALHTLILHMYENPNRISLHSKKLNDDVRTVWDMVQEIRHHTYKLKTEEEQKREPDGKEVHKISKCKAIKVKLV